MEQRTLFGKSKEETPIEDNKDTEEVKEIENDEDSGWTDPINKKALDQQQTKGASWTYLQLVTTSNLKDGTVRKISISTTSEGRRGFMGSSYGSGGDDLKIENPQPYFDGLMKEKLDEQKDPYKDFPEGKEVWELEDAHHSSSDFYRTIPIENHIVIVGKKLKELLKEKGFDFDEWYVGYMAIEENNATEEHEKQTTEWKEIAQKELELLKKVKLVKESIRYKLGERKGEYGGPAIRDYFEDKGLDAIHKELKGLANEIRTMDSKLKEILNNFGRRNYSDYVIYGADDADKVLR